jgi:hypothetical protein
VAVCAAQGESHFLNPIITYANVATVFRTYRNVGFVSAAIPHFQEKRWFSSEFKHFSAIHPLGITVAIGVGVVLKTHKCEARRVP